MGGATIAQLQAAREALSEAVSSPVRPRNMSRRVDTRAMPRSQAEKLFQSLTGRPSGIRATPMEATEVSRLVELAKSMPTPTVGPLPSPHPR